GPMSNAASPPQRVDAAGYAGEGGLADFAARWRGANLGRWSESERLAASCLLLKRPALERVGGFDESLPGGFCVDDLCRRLRAAGFTLAVARDLYVHHFDEAWTLPWNRAAQSWDQI